MSLEIVFTYLIIFACCILIFCFLILMPILFWTSFISQKIKISKIKKEAKKYKKETDNYFDNMSGVEKLKFVNKTKYENKLWSDCDCDCDCDGDGL